MENNGTLSQLATFFDKLVAEQVAEEVAKQMAESLPNINKNRGSGDYLSPFFKKR